jgi:FixJ family two-component response regulator
MRLRHTVTSMLGSAREFGATHLAEDMQTHSRSANDRGVVFVVDDDAAVRNSLKFSLEIEGFEVLVFADGQQLLGQSELPVPGCLVVDQHLPQMKGLELITELRRRDSRIPAILITSNPSDAIRRQAALAGVPIVEKPLLNSMLFDVIRQAMAQRPQVLH